MANETACFFAHVSDRSLLERVEFYKQDVDILRELGLHVTLATRWSEIPWDADFYYVWWWTWAFLPLLKATPHKRPVVITGVFDHMWKGDKWDFDQRPWWQQWLLRFALRRANANIFGSQLEYNRVTQRFGVRNSYYSPHIVDTSIYCPGQGPREDVVLTVAWMQGLNAERKCIPEVIEAAQIVLKSHPTTRFIIAGERGSYYPKLSALAEELGIADRISFPGTIPREKKIELMQQCKVYLQPTRYEGFGLAILEAMSCGAPVVTSPSGAVPEVVGDAALLVDATSPEAIAHAVNRLLDGDGLRKQLGRLGRNRAVTNFPYERRKSDLELVVRRVLERR